MRYFILLCSALSIAIYSLNAQENFRVIGAAGQIERSLDSDFYISAIEDQRSFQANMGIVNRGAGKALKRPLIEEAGFFDTILVRMNSWLRPEEGAKPVIVQVRELYLWEHLRKRGGLGFIRLKAAFVEPDKNAVTLAEVQLSGEALNVSSAPSPRLEEALFRSLGQFIARREKASAVPVAEKQPSSSGSRIMAAANFLDLREGRYSETFVRLRRANGSGLARYSLSGGNEDKFYPYYAVIRGEEWYIRGNNYPGAGEYYTRVLEKGRYLYLEDEVYIEPESELREELPNSPKKVGVLIDMETGIPRIINDELMEQLMAPYPALQEKYLFKEILKYPVQLTRVKNVIAEINMMEDMN